MKYLLDTNIISEVTKPTPNPAVVSWLQGVGHDAGTCSICVEELYFGLHLMPEGKRKKKLQQHIDTMVRNLRDQTLPFDSFASRLCAELRAKAHMDGYTVSLADTMIASIARANNCVVATRNVKDFEVFGVETFNPFEYVA